MIYFLDILPVVKKNCPKTEIWLTLNIITGIT